MGSNAIKNDINLYIFYSKLKETLAVCVEKNFPAIPLTLVKKNTTEYKLDRLGCTTLFFSHEKP